MIVGMIVIETGDAIETGRGIGIGKGKETETEKGGIEIGKEIERGKEIGIAMTEIRSVLKEVCYFTK